MRLIMFDYDIMARIIFRSSRALFRHHLSIVALTDYIASIVAIISKQRHAHVEAHDDKPLICRLRSVSFSFLHVSLLLGHAAHIYICV